MMTSRIELVGKSWPDATTQPVYDAFARGKANAAARRFRLVQTLEGQEDLLGVLGIESSPVIGDGYNSFLSSPEAFNLNMGRLRWAPELQRIADQVLKYQRQQRPIREAEHDPCPSSTNPSQVRPFRRRAGECSAAGLWSAVLLAIWL